AIIVVLEVAGAGALHLVLPITISIVALLAILVFSYRQVIDAYPGGGGAYAVSRANLGHGAGLVAAGALVVDYTLTVAVSFSAGCSALTGVEAIANGVPLFKEPRVRRAKRTELLLGTILGVMLLGLAVLADRWHVGPRSGQTVLSQIMAMAVGRNWAYYVMSLTITLVLALAANTSFGGLPVLASLLAKDHYLPHLFSLRDDRQVFAPGIWALAIFSGVLLIAVRGNVLTLLPLFAIGVFTGFTLSQSGLVVHWWRTRPPRWEFRAAINGLG